jgi:hypothetical protein
MPALGIGLNIGLPNVTDALRVGLEVILTGRDNVRPDADFEHVTVGDDAAELAVEVGIVIGRGRGYREVPFALRPSWEREGETARRFEDDG